MSEPADTPGPARVERPALPDSTTVWRVRGRASFGAFRKSRWRARRGPIMVTFVPLGSGPVGSESDAKRPPAVAYAIGRNVGGAVQRNRLRRRLRPMMAELAVEGVLAGGDYLVGATAAAVDCQRVDLQRSLRAACAAAQTRGSRT